MCAVADFEFFKFDCKNFESVSMNNYVNILIFNHDTILS